jgi:hypothetical protein
VTCTQGSWPAPSQDDPGGQSARDAEEHTIEVLRLGLPVGSVRVPVRSANSASQRYTCCLLPPAAVQMGAKASQAAMYGAVCMHAACCMPTSMPGACLARSCQALGPRRPSSVFVRLRVPVARFPCGPGATAGHGERPAHAAQVRGGGVPQRRGSGASGTRHAGRPCPHAACDTRTRTRPHACQVHTRAQCPCLRSVATAYMALEALAARGLLTSASEA